MCGIAGYVRSDGAEADLLAALSMVRTLAHRGPDEERVREVAPGGAQPTCVFAHQRLRIIDLSDAASQPMSMEDGALSIVFNGEIYNFRELRDRLASEGDTFHSTGDTEVLLRAIARFGHSALREIDGMFAFAAWHAPSQELILARDRLGKKPLFYAEHDGVLLFGSEIKALLAYPGFAPGIDVARIPEVLAFGYVPSPVTMYEGVRQVPPGTFVRWTPTGGVHHPESYWSSPFSSHATPVPWPEAEREAWLAIQRAVERRLVADVPLGVLLSGGLDSSIVVAAAAALGARPRTFTASVSGGKGFDERRWARIVAGRFGTEHVEISVDEDASSLIDLAVRATDQPFADSSAVATYLLAKSTSEHVSVALTGDGGDEVFGGYERFAAASWAAILPKAVQRVGSVATGLLPSKGGYHDFRDRAARFLLEVDESPEHRYRSWVGVFDAAALHRVLSPDLKRLTVGRPFDAFERALASAPESPLLHRLMSVNMQTYLPDDLLVKTDRMSMAVSLEARSPLLDTSLVEYVAALPPEMKATPFGTKRLLRRIASRVLPREIARRRKHGFGVPVDDWFRGSLAPTFREVVMTPEARCNDVLDPSGVAELFRAHVDGGANHGHRLWALLALEVWLGQQPGPGRPEG